ncbi:uncharacterized protein LOC134267002 isoform X2 [Saccostrea cucullata]|uniref:uncharacterized protein LOC134267002 isoform X2 n=1 Tax=Saccostrea cuccullata TaxID=36930 RepID=UPI002ED2BD85
MTFPVVLISLGTSFIIFLHGVCCFSYYCDNGWLLYRNRCYRRYMTDISWQGSRSACLNSGAILASVTDSGVQSFLQSNVISGDDAWIGGTDGGTEGTWVWVDTEDPFTYSNWYPGEPNNKNNEDCLQFYGTSRRFRWNDLPFGHNLRGYICMKGECLKTDVLFLIDDSSSVFDAGFTYSKKVAAKLMDCMTIGPDEIRIALMTFGSSTSTHFGFDRYNDKQSIKSAITGARYRGQTRTNIGSALSYAQNLMNSNPSDRLDIIIVITDGKSHDSVYSQSSSLHLKGVYVFAMGSGGDVNSANLETIASNPNSDYHVTSNDYYDLHKKVSKLINGLCIGHITPDFMTCEMEVKDSYGEKAQSPTNGSSDCANQLDFYGKYQPEFIHTHVMIDGKHRGFRSSISPTEFHFGVLHADIALVKRSKSDADQTIGRSSIKESTDYQPLVSKDINMTNSVIFHDSERFCLIFRASVGGYITLHTGKYTYGTTDAERTLCYFYDDIPPRHCADIGSCSCPPLQLSDEITNMTSLNVSFAGWEDFDSVSAISKFASGIGHFEISLHEMEYSNKVLKMKHASKIARTRCNNCSNFLIDLPHTQNPMLYGVVVEVVDVALNPKQARRFFLYDASSRLEIHEQNKLRVTSASEKTNFIWQIDHSKLCYNWTNRFYNNKFIHYNPLSPIDPGVHGHFTGIYEQTNGLFNVSGTTNINGITKFHFDIKKDLTPVMNNHIVPNFPQQSMCVDIPGMSDGNTISFKITAFDITGHQLEDGVVHFIDASPPEINDAWLIRDGMEEIFVHSLKDLSKMVLKFEAFDEHSGLKSVQWSIKNKDDQIEFGHGALGVYSVSSCTSVIDCYCPSVGECQRLNYTLIMNSLVANNSHIGKHHREYSIEITVTNNAALQSKETVIILVDESAPETGVVKEGAAGSPDIDYTSSPPIKINWEGFIDHESGIKFYRIGLSSSCLRLEDLWHPTGSSIEYYDTEDMSKQVILDKSGKTFASVIAFNNAMEPSKVVCSDGVQLDRTPPVISNISVRNMMASSSLGCTNGKYWFITENLTRVAIMCNKTCLNGTNEILLNALPVSSTNSVPDDACLQNDFMGEYLYLGSDFFDISWNITDKESNIEDVFVGIGSSLSSVAAPDVSGYTKTHHNTFYRLRHSGISANSVIYIFIKAVNKAGMESVIPVGPIIVDETPPMCLNKPTTEVTKTDITVTWSSDDFIDIEQRGALRKIYYRIVSGGATRVTNFRKWTKTDYCSKNRNCFTFPVSELQHYDGGSSRQYQFEFHVYNTAGHYCTIFSEEFSIPSKFYPIRGKVFDIDPSTNMNDELADVDVSLTLDRYCLYWENIDHEESLIYEVGIGNSKEVADVVAMHEINGSSTTEQSIFCESTTKLARHTKYFVILRVSSSRGTISMSTDGFIIIDVNEFQNFLKVNDGPGCLFSKLLFEQNVNIVPPNSTVSSVNVSFPLTIGTTYTTFINTSSINVTINSGGVLFLNRRIKSFSFIALEHHPVFEIIPNEIGDSKPFTFRTFRCEEDVDVQDISAEIGANWEVDARVERFISHYLVSLLSCENIPNSSCEAIISNSVVKRASYTFTDIYDSLQQGFYKVFIKPCFGNKCFSGLSSDGFFLESFGPDFGSLSAELTVDNGHCLKLQLNFQSFQCAFPFETTPMFYRWAVFSDVMGHMQLTEHQIQLNNTRQQTVTSCLKFPHKRMHTCLEGYCRSGRMSKTCSQINVQQDPNSYTKTTVYDLDAKSDFFVEIEAYKYTTNIGRKLEDLHSYEIDFKSDFFVLGGFVIGIGDAEILWSVMKSPRIPLRCEDDPECIYSKSGRGGLIAFSSKVPLKSNVIYYICVNDSANFIVNRCSNGFVIDLAPPPMGKVKLHTKKEGFITDDSSVNVYWQGFENDDFYSKIGYPSNIRFYEVAIGTEREKEDVLQFKNVQLTSSILLTNLSLVGGMSYYFSVKACDHALNCIIGSSEPYIYDKTSPERGTITVGHYLNHRVYVDSSLLIVHCTGFKDPESGVMKFEIGIGSQNNSSDVISNSEFFQPHTEILTKGLLHDGHMYYVFAQVWNHAGLFTSVSSLPIVADSTPPEPGAVRDGPWLNHVDEDYTTFSTISSHWTEFVDGHSPIDFYRVGLGTRHGLTDVVSFTFIGRQTEWTWKTHPILGIRYFTTVEGCNAAGLCSQSSSNGVIVDFTPPIPGYVSVGPENVKYIAHTSFLSVEWGNFADIQSGILQYDICIGTDKMNCSVIGWRNYRLEQSVLLLNLSLPINVDLFIMVNATNKAGLSTVQTSHSFTVDNTPPEITLSPRFLYGENVSSVIYDSSVMRVRWGFTDNESPIRSSVLTLKVLSGGHFEIENVLVEGNETFVKSLPLKKWLSDGDSYYVVVTACNMAGLCTSSKSEIVLFDGTPPSHGHVISVGTWSNSNSTLTLKWANYSDPESGIKLYFITVGETYNGFELTMGSAAFTHIGNEGSLQQGVFNLSRNLTNGEKIVMSIWAMNNANLNSTMRRVTFVTVSNDKNNTNGDLFMERHSCEVSYCTNDCTCAVLGGKCLEVVNSQDCRQRNMSYLAGDAKVSLNIWGGYSNRWTTSTRCLGANWFVENINVSRFEWSMGLLNMPHGFGVFDRMEEQVWHDVSLQTRVVHCLKPTRQLAHEREYVAYLKTWISSTDFILTQSEQILIDASAPSVRRGRFIIDSDKVCSRDQEFTNTKNIISCWKDVFSDPQSGIREYKFMVGVTPGGYEIFGIKSVGLAINFTWTFANLEPGVKYYASVEAVNFVGLSTVLTSDGITIDFSPPESGIVFTSNFFHDTKWLSETSTVSASWEGFTDFESSIDRYVVSLKDSNQNVIREEEEVGISNKHTFTGLSLLHGKSYFVLVRAVDAAGHSSNVSVSPPVTVDVSKPIGVRCNTYSVQINATVEIRAGVKEELIKAFSFKRDTLYKVFVSGERDSNMNSIIVEVSGTSFDIPFSPNMMDLVIMSKVEETAGVAVTVNSLKPRNVTLNFALYECMDAQTNASNAIVFRQISPNLLSVAVNAIDPESDLKDIQIYLGTNWQGRQLKTVKSLTPFRFQNILLPISHGTKVYPSALVENNAGLKQYFKSDPIVWDHTPPDILIKNVSVEYHDVIGRIRSSIIVHWEVTEYESGIQYCQCAFGDKFGLKNLQTWMKSHSNSLCRSSLLEITHGSRVYASAQCFNKVGLQAEVSRKTPIVISFDSPRTPTGHVDFVVYSATVKSSINYQRISSSLHFHWPAFQDISGIAKYSVCIKSDEVMVYDWRDVGRHTYFSTDELTLDPHKNYSVYVFGTNKGEKDSNLINGSISINDVVPLQTGNPCVISGNNTSLLVSWKEVFELTSVLEPKFVVNIGSKVGYSDLLNNFKTSNNEYLMSSNSKQFYVVITAKYVTGSKSTYRELITANYQ